MKLKYFLIPFIILLLLTVIILGYNLCSANISKNDKDTPATDNSEEQIDTNASDETSYNNDYKQQEDSNTDEDSSEGTGEDTAQDENNDSNINPDAEEEIEKVPPSITLDILEGPLYTESRDICYYRIGVTVEGTPSPSITFSKDDSNGAWGENICQVNLYEPGDSYTLTAKAVNSEGEASKSIVLSWESIDEPLEAVAGEGLNDEAFLDDSMEAIDVILPPLYGGYIIEDVMLGVAGTALIGDYTDNSPIKGFFSFDITQISGKEILDARIEFYNYDEIGNPMAFLDFVLIKKVNWGEDPPNIFDLPGISLGHYNYPTFTCTGETLISELQKASNLNESVFQISLENMGSDSDYDDLAEYMVYNKQTSIRFTVTYKP